jgi:hypothetical protein
MDLDICIFINGPEDVDTRRRADYHFRAQVILVIVIGENN